MRLREILTFLIDEVKKDHWDGPGAAWRHQRDACRACAVAMDAQTALTVNFIDFEPGDTVRIGPGLIFGVVEQISLVVDVRLGYPTALGVRPHQDGVIGHFKGNDLVRVEPGG